MADVTLQHMTNGQNISVANNNFDKIQDNINNHSLQSDGGNNTLYQDLDLNSHSLLNAKTNVNNPGSVITVGDADNRYYIQHAVTGPSQPTDAANKQYVDGGDAAQQAYTNQVAANFAAGLGNFIQTGTGAVTRTFLDKMRDYASVRDFGAKGDGVTDDTVAFQNAIASGLDVLVPWTSASYLIKQPLLLSKASMFGEVRNGSYSKLSFQLTLGTENKSTADGGKVFDLASWVDAITLDFGLSPGHFEKIWVECNTTARNGVVVKAVNNGARVRDIKVTNPARDGFLFYATRSGYIENLYCDYLYSSFVGRYYYHWVVDFSDLNANPYINESRFQGLEGRDGCGIYIAGRPMNFQVINAQTLSSQKMSGITLSNINMDAKSVASLTGSVLASPIKFNAVNAALTPAAGNYECFRIYGGGMENLGGGASPGGYVVDGDETNTLLQLQDFEVGPFTYYNYGSGYSEKVLAASRVASTTIDAWHGRQISSRADGIALRVRDVGTDNTGMFVANNVGNIYWNKVTAPSGGGTTTTNIQLAKTLSNNNYYDPLVVEISKWGFPATNMSNDQYGRYLIKVARDGTGNYLVGASLLNSVANNVAFGFDPAAGVTWSINSSGSFPILVLTVVWGASTGSSGSNRTAYVSAAKLAHGTSSLANTLSL